MRDTWSTSEPIITNFSTLVLKRNSYKWPEKKAMSLTRNDIKAIVDLSSEIMKAKR